MGRWCSRLKGVNGNPGGNWDLKFNTQLLRQNNWAHPRGGAPSGTCTNYSDGIIRRLGATNPHQKQMNAVESTTIRNRRTVLSLSLSVTGVKGLEFACSNEARLIPHEFEPTKCCTDSRETLEPKWQA